VVTVVGIVVVVTSADDGPVVGVGRVVVGAVVDVGAVDVVEEGATVVGTVADTSAAELRST
jgi:hypothetical protein